MINIQGKGVPIGGTISGLLAEVILQEGENRVLKTKVNNLVGFDRYVDDALVIWSNQKSTVATNVGMTEQKEDTPNGGIQSI